MLRNRLLPLIAVLAAACLARCTGGPQPVAKPASASSSYCVDGSTCEQHLRSIAKTIPQGVVADTDTLAAELRDLGEPGWQCIAALSVDKDRRVRNVAGYVMGEWRILDDGKIPAIDAALHLEPGSWPAHALERLATPRAIDALIADVERTDSGNQSSFALVELMPASLPAVLSVLQAGEPHKLFAGLNMRDM